MDDYNAVIVATIYCLFHLVWWFTYSI